MKVSCTAKEIASAVGAASKVVNPHTTVPILSNVLLVAENGVLAVRATDLELTLEHTVAAEVLEPGSVTVPARLFSGYLANLPSGVLELTGTPTRATVKCERSNYDFHALPADEYPPLPIAQRGSQFTLPAKRFRDAVNGTIFAASTEEARGAVLMGTLIELDGDELTMVAIDGYRIAKWQTTLDSGISGRESFIVPSRALAEVARNTGGAESVTVTALGPHSNQLHVAAGSVSVIVRLVDGEYINYRQIIPAEFDRSITVNTEAFIGSLRRAEVVAGGRASMVQLTVENHTLVVTASSEQSGNAYEELEVEQHGNGVTIAFNARYLIDVLNHIDSPRTLMEFHGPLAGAALRPVEPPAGARQFYLVMPLRQ